MAAGYVGTPKLVKLALGDGTDSVILSNISEGVDGATPTPITISPIGEFSFEDGQAGVSGYEWSLTMAGMVSGFTDAGVAGTNADGLAKLLSWGQAQTQLEFAGIALGGYAFTSGYQKTNYYISSVQKYTASGGRVYVIVTIKKATLDGKNNGIYDLPKLNNSVIGGNYAWEEDGATGKPVAMVTATSSGTTSLSFVDPDFDVVYDTSGSVDFAYEFFFPFSGTTITATVNFTDVVGTATTGNQVVIKEIDYAGVSGSNANTTFSTTGEKSVSKTLGDTDLYNVEFTILEAVGGVSGAGVITITNMPTITVTKV